MYCGSSKILNHGLNHESFLSRFKFLGWKYMPNLVENSGLKSWLLYSLRFYALLGAQANLLETSPLSKLCFETKMTKLGVGHLTSIGRHFFANYISSFHKSEVLTVILKDPTCQNLCWIKSHNIKHNCFLFLLFSICKKKNGDIQLMNSHFLTIFGNFFGDYINIFQKIEIQNIILRCIVSQNLSWIKSYNII